MPNSVSSRTPFFSRGRHAHGPSEGTNVIPGSLVVFLFGGFFPGIFWYCQGTPLKINMEHNHGGLEDHFPF